MQIKTGPDNQDFTEGGKSEAETEKNSQDTTEKIQFRKCNQSGLSDQDTTKESQIETEIGKSSQDTTEKIRFSKSNQRESILVMEPLFFWNCGKERLVWKGPVILLLLRM